MYVIINFKNKQYKVSEGDKLLIDYLNIKKNKIFIINNILLLSDKFNYFIFNKIYLKKIFIICRIINHFKDKKIKIIKMKKRKNFQKIIGFKRKNTLIIIEKIFINFLKF